MLIQFKMKHEFECLNKKAPWFKNCKISGSKIRAGEETILPPLTHLEPGEESRPSPSTETPVLSEGTQGDPRPAHSPNVRKNKLVPLSLKDKFVIKN